jgi:prepilin-type N-terminal cleavage/methylation domain-containing protein
MTTIRTHSPQGFTLIEVLLALALFSIIFTTLAQTSLMPDIALHDLRARTRASEYALEGITIARAMRDQDMDSLLPGVYGIVRSPEGAQFAGTFDTREGMERSLYIAEIDNDAVSVESRVTYVHGMDSEEVVEQATLYDLYETRGDAFNLRVSDVGTLWQFMGYEGILLANVGQTEVALVGVTATWEGDAGIRSVLMDGEVVFETASSSPVLSGTRIPLQDRTVSIGSVHRMDLMFTEYPTTNDLTLRVECADGSVRNSYLNL